MTETLAHWYSSENTQRELSYEYQHDRVWMVLKKKLHPCALVKSNLSIESVKTGAGLDANSGPMATGQ